MASVQTYILYREDPLGRRYPLKTFYEDEDNSKSLAEEFVELEANLPEDHKAVLISSERGKWELTKDYTWREL